ncbi:MAG: hypothetical protein F6J90_26040 [Moorea sp. SIOASIH]|uniref:hypothetical protein n=1 Tax=Moorena sp. SIOASIH TaxID=2607817 RepID=UPI0013B9C922|nr:hypothetical protein [Moorena sp. SIOASIH]NEO39604.1 hypothetical protein [Moorena sp. SIOASIH]
MMPKISRSSILARCILFKGFGPVVRYGTGYPNPGDRDNQGEPVPNAPYPTIAYSLLPTPYSLLPTPYSLN